MAKGKMANSPFQVETIKYRYAVEHENDFSVQTLLPDCKYLELRANYCKLWNSGNNYCAKHKCKIINTGLQRNVLCESCAYCIQQECFMPRKPMKEEFNTDAARYCAFYCGESKSKEKYRYVRNICERLYYTRIESYHLKCISSKKKYIREAKEELKNATTSEEDLQYLRRKIESKMVESKEHEMAVVQVQKILDKLGGRLINFPKNKQK